MLKKVITREVDLIHSYIYELGESMIEFLIKGGGFKESIYEKNSLKRHYSVQESNFVRDWLCSFSNSRVGRILDTGLKQ